MKTIKCHFQGKNSFSTTYFPNNSPHPPYHWTPAQIYDLKQPTLTPVKTTVITNIYSIEPEYDRLIANIKKSHDSVNVELGVIQLSTGQIIHRCKPSLKYAGRFFSSSHSKWVRGTMTGTDESQIGWACGNTMELWDLSRNAEKTTISLPQLPSPQARGDTGMKDIVCYFSRDKSEGFLALLKGQKVDIINTVTKTFAGSIPIGSGGDGAFVLWGDKLVCPMHRSWKAGTRGVKYGVYDIKEKKLIYDKFERNWWINNPWVSFVKEGKFVLSEKLNQIRVYDIANETDLGTMKMNSNTQLECVDLQGSLLIASDSNELKIFDIGTKNVLQTIPGGKLRFCVWNDTLISVEKPSLQLKMWKLPTG